jgi:hypothetical protein
VGPDATFLSNFKGIFLSDFVCYDHLFLIRCPNSINLIYKKILLKGNFVTLKYCTWTAVN